MDRQFAAIHLQMIRCAGRLNIVELAGQGESIYTLFDYYDALIVKEEKDQKYVRYEDCIGQTEDDDQAKQKHRTYVAAVNRATLVRFANNMYPPDLFDGGLPDSKAYSDKPFLAVMILTLKQDCLPAMKDKEPNHILPFLESCIHELEAKAKEYFVENRIDEASYRVAAFATMDMGHFAVVIRSAIPEPAYMVARKLTGENAFSKCDISELKEMRLEAFTTLGMEMGITWGSKEICRKQPVANMSKWYDQCRMVLRVGHSRLLPWMQGMLEGDEGGDLHKLNGRYQYTQRVSAKRYIEILPELCYYKFGLTDENQNPEFEKVPAFVHATDVINDRILLNAKDDLNPKGTDSKFIDTESQYPAFTQNLQDGGKLAALLQDKLQKVRHKEYVLPYGHGIFYENIRLFREVTGTCSSILRFADSYHNGTILYMLLFLALDSLDVYLDWLKQDTDGEVTESTIHAKSDRKAVCKDLLISLSGCLEDIVSFLKSIQSVNFQTLQAPHYEIQPGADGEKYVIAVQEFARRFSLDWVKYRDKDAAKAVLQTGKYFFPFMCIDHHFGGPRSYLRFLPPRQHISAAPRETPILLNIAAPNFQYFVRPYDLLPLVIHETSHNLRFLPRPERNKAFLTIVFHRIAQRISEMWLSEDDKDEIMPYWREFRSMVREALADVMIDTFYSKNTKSDGTMISWDNQIMTELKDAVGAFLYRSVFWMEDAPADFLSQSGEKRAVALKKLIQEFYQYACLYVGKSDGDMKNIQDICMTAYKNIDGGDHDKLKKLVDDKIQNAIVDNFFILELDSLYPLFLLKEDKSPNPLDASEADSKELQSPMDKSPNPPEATKSDSVKPLRTSIGHELLTLCLQKKVPEMAEPTVAIGNLLDVKKKMDYTAAFLEYESAPAFKLLLDELERKYSAYWHTIMGIQKNKTLNAVVDQAIREVRSSFKRLMELRILLDRFRITCRLWDGKVSPKDDPVPLEPHAEYIHQVADKLLDKVQSSMDSIFNPVSQNILSDSGILGKKFLLSSNVEYLEQDLAACLRSASYYDTSILLKSAELFYDEACADLAMCAAMNFEPCGYLRLFVRHENRINESSWTASTKNISFERMNAVLITMLYAEAGGTNVLSLADENQGEYVYVFAGVLIEKQKKVIDEVYEAVQAKFEKAQIDNAIMDPFMVYLRSKANQLKKKLNTLLKGGASEDKLSVPEEITDLIRKYKQLYALKNLREAQDCELPGIYLQEWRYMLISIVFLMVYGQQISVRKKGKKSKEDFKRVFALRLLKFPLDYFARLYNELKKQSYSCLQGDSLRREIGNYYSKHRIVLAEDERRDMLDYTFAYVLQYYYSSRFSLPDITGCENEDVLRTKIVEYLGKV